MFPGPSPVCLPVPQVYLSPLLNKDFKDLDGRRKRQLLKDSAPSSLVSGQTNGVPQPRPIDVLPSHNLTSTRIVEQLSGSQDLARMLADYRAKGGRIRQREAADPFSSAGAPVSAQSRAADATVKPPVKTDSEEEKPSKPNDMTWAPKVSSVETVIHERCLWSFPVNEQKLHSVLLTEA